MVFKIILSRAGHLWNIFWVIGEMSSKLGNVFDRWFVPLVPGTVSYSALPSAGASCTNCQNKQKQYNCLLIHPRVPGDWLSCKSSFYCSTLERMLGGTLVSGETFIGAQSIASLSRSPLKISFSRSPTFKYPSSCSLKIIQCIGWKSTNENLFRCNCILSTNPS